MFGPEGIALRGALEAGGPRLQGAYTSRGLARFLSANTFGLNISLTMFLDRCRFNYRMHMFSIESWRGKQF